jgi:mercuric ion transport protein
MKGKAAGALALVSAGLASVCCLGPVLLAGLGLGGVGLAAGLEKYRPWFLAATGVFLGLAFYRVCRAQAACAEGACRTAPSRGVKVALWIAVAAAVGLASFPAWAPLLLIARSSAHQHAPAAKAIKFAVAGMDCPACTPGIEKSLKSIPGVQDAVIDFDKKEAVVYAEPGKVIANQLIEAIRAAGPYSATQERN